MLETDLCDDLDLLAMAILALPDDRLQPPDDSVLQLTRARDHQLHLSAIGAHQLGKLLTDALQQAQPVVLGQRLQEIFDGSALVSGGTDRTDVFLQLGDDGRLVGFGQGGGVEDGRELGVGLEHLMQRGQGSGDGVEGGGFGGGGVLLVDARYLISGLHLLSGKRSWLVQVETDWTGLE